MRGARGRRLALRGGAAARPGRARPGEVEDHPGRQPPSRLGQLLDPAADRLYILATLVGLAGRGIIPVWLAIAIPLRDVLLAPTILLLRRRGLRPLPVHYLGKAATFSLLCAFPLLLIGAGDNAIANLAHPLAWAFTIWGTGLYWWGGVIYARQVRLVLRS